MKSQEVIVIDVGKGLNSSGTTKVIRTQVREYNYLTYPPSLRCWIKVDVTVQFVNGFGSINW